MEWATAGVAALCRRQARRRRPIPASPARPAISNQPAAGSGTTPGSGSGGGVRSVTASDVNPKLIPPSVMSAISKSARLKPDVAAVFNSELASSNKTFDVEVGTKLKSSNSLREKARLAELPVVVETTGGGKPDPVRLNELLPGTGTPRLKLTRTCWIPMVAGAGDATTSKLSISTPPLSNVVA